MPGHVSLTCIDSISRRPRSESISKPRHTLKQRAIGLGHRPTLIATAPTGTAQGNREGVGAPSHVKPIAHASRRASASPASRPLPETIKGCRPPLLLHSRCNGVLGRSCWTAWRPRIHLSREASRKRAAGPGKVFLRPAALSPGQPKPSVSRAKSAGTAAGRGSVTGIASELSKFRRIFPRLAPIVSACFYRRRESSFWAEGGTRWRTSSGTRSCVSNWT